MAGGIAKRLVDGQGTGPEPEHLHFETVTQGADAVATRIAEAAERGEADYADFAVLRPPQQQRRRVPARPPRHFLAFPAATLEPRA